MGRRGGIRHRLVWRAGAGLGALGLLAACDAVPSGLAPESSLRPTQIAAVAPPPAPLATSPASASLRARLAQVQSAQLTQGLLRQDGGGPDTPYTSEMLARNFISATFFNEYDTGAGLSGVLRRWDGPVRMEVLFGASVPPSQRLRDRRDTAQYAERLSRVTRHPISVSRNANFHVIFAGEDDRADVIDDLAARLPLLDDQTRALLKALPRDIYCAVVAYGAPDNPSQYVAAVAVIRSENPDLLRLSCIHEELAQGLGLANDSPTARPSIFNDDDEFALLTSHDEALLGMLYDPRLRTGIPLAEAEPIVRQLARERKGDPV